MKKETIAVRGNFKPDNGQYTTIPVHQNTTYAYDTSKDLADLFSLQAAGHIYSRISNPTVSYLEEKVAFLEGGVGCLAASSGHAATVNTIFNLCKQGDHIVSSAKIYGGVYNLLSFTLPKYGITTTFIDPEASYEEILDVVQDNTKIIFSEVLANPDLTLTDVSKFAKVANKANIPYVVDNTLLTPALYRPFEDGAHIVIHSGTKYFDGHGSSLAGFIIDSGQYDFGNGKFPDLLEGDPSYHGVSYTKAFGNLGFLIKARTQYTRDFGNYLAPFSAYIINQNLETLPLRMKQTSDNALKLAKFLESSDQVEKVYYPLLESNKQYDLAKKILKDGASGVVSFEIKGDREQAEKFTDSLNLVNIMAHFGDVRTGIIHPASTTHSQLSSESLKAAGISDNFIRVTVGLENIEDIIDDFKQAFQKCL